MDALRRGLAVNLTVMTIAAYPTQAEAFAALKKHEIDTTTRFVTGQATKNFGKLEQLDKTSIHKIFWDYDIPYVSCGRKVLFCHHGKDYHRKKKERRRKGDEADHSSYIKPQLTPVTPVTPQRVVQSKKLDCPAKVEVKEVFVFFDLKTDEDPSKHKKNKNSLILRERIASGIHGGTKRFILTLPRLEDHKNHPIGEEAGLTEPIDKELIDVIVQFIDEGVYDSPSMKQHLEQYVLRCHPAILRTNRRFYPAIRTIQNHMNKALRLKFPNGEHKAKVKGSRQREEGSKRKNRTGVTKKNDLSTKNQTKVRPPTQWNPKVNTDGTMFQHHYIDDTADHEDEVVHCPPDYVDEQEVQSATQVIQNIACVLSSMKEDQHLSTQRKRKSDMMSPDDLYKRELINIEREMLEETRTRNRLLQEMNTKMDTLIALKRVKLFSENQLILEH
ncbi:uncharacterized protein LOC127842016 isoform X2 [Dreissena polymorpha]|uniref:uncharacterized protein LOC127842016 isoform X2 n=1 Tax=Dreissena polymorpha TaxID=45954 RepID=UPI00226450A3|nr:uncharacterized protein LOC127842016 isoform X2 [Dreissena polymorpha]